MRANIKPRNNCKREFLILNKLTPIEGIKIAVVNKVWKTNRNQTTCKTGKLCTSHLALVSSTANIRVVTVTKAMPIRRWLAVSEKSWDIANWIARMTILNVMHMPFQSGGIQSESQLF